MSGRYGRRRFLRVAAGFSAGLGGAALLGCGGDDDGAASIPTAGPGHRVRLRAPLLGGGEIVLPSELALGVLAEDVGPDGLDAMTRGLAYSRLFTFDPRSSAVHGDLADEVELVEPLLVRVRLREEVYFHPSASGEVLPVTPEGVARDFEARRAEGVFVFTDVIESVEVPGERDLLLRLRAPFSLLFEHLSHTDASVRGEADYAGVPAPTGSGAFLPVGRDGDNLRLVPSPLRDGEERPYLGQIVVTRGRRSSDLDALFVGGQLDVREHPDATSRQTAHRRTGRLELARPRQALRGLALSVLGRDGGTESPVAAFRDDRVRRAVALSVNRTALGFVDGAALSGPVGPSFEGDALPLVELTSHPLYEHQPDEASRLLAAAGYEGLTFRLSHPDNPVMLQLVQRLVQQLSLAGIRALPVSRSEDAFQSTFLAGDFEAAFFELDRMTSPDIGLRLHTTGGLDGRRSPWGYSNPVYDAKVVETLSQLDPALRARHAREAQRLLLDDIPAMLPLLAPLEYASLAQGVVDYQFDAYGFNATALASRWLGPRQFAEGGL